MNLYYIIYGIITKTVRTGTKVTAFKIDLVHNGQYRMVEVSQFFVVRDNIDDIMLIPATIQKIEQIKVSTYSSHFLFKSDNLTYFI